MLREKGDISAVDVVDAARGWMGTRFHHQGRVKASGGFYGGCDCLGLLVGVARELGLVAKNGGFLAEYDVRDYGHLPDAARLKAVLEGLLLPVAEKDMRAADVLLLRVAGVAQHLAIVTEHPYGGLGMVHALAVNRRVVEHRLDGQWLGRVEAVYRLPALAF